MSEAAIEKYIEARESVREMLLQHMARFISSHKADGPNVRSWLDRDDPREADTTKDRLCVAMFYPSQKWALDVKITPDEDWQIVLQIRCVKDDFLKTLNIYGTVETITNTAIEEMRPSLERLRDLLGCSSSSSS
jgi:hypothetical protein